MTLDYLLQQLADTRGPEELDRELGEAGTSLGFLWELVGWWQTGFDWRPEVRRQLLRPQSGHQGRGELHFVYERPGPRTTRIGPAPAEAAQLSFRSTA